MRFLVRALDGQQRILDVAVEALDEAEARRLAAERQLVALTVSADRGASNRRFPLLLFAQELHALVLAGLSVVEALDALIEKNPSPDVRAVIARVCTGLREGMRLSAALRQQSQHFPPLFIGIVQAAEGTSDLPGALGRYIEYETRLEAARHRVVSAAIYPAVLALVGGAVCIFLLLYVVPRFAAVYKGNGRSLPWASQVLLNWGELATQHGASLGIGLLATLLAVCWWSHAQWRRGGLQRLLNWIPGAAPRLREYELARLYMTLGTLLEGGMPLPHALSLANAVIAPERVAALDRVRSRIEEGLPFSEALTEAGLSTPVAARLLRVGEHSGQLGAMLTRTARFYETETARWIERFSKAFEPLLMAAIGLVVGLIVILMYMPIFELAGSLQ